MPTCPVLRAAGEVGERASRRGALAGVPGLLQSCAFQVGVMGLRALHSPAAVHVLHVAARLVIRCQVRTRKASAVGLVRPSPSWTAPAEGMHAHLTSLLCRSENRTVHPYERVLSSLAPRVPGPRRSSELCERTDGPALLCCSCLRVSRMSRPRSARFRRGYRKSRPPLSMRAPASSSERAQAQQEVQHKCVVEQRAAQSCAHQARVRSSASELRKL